MATTLNLDVQEQEPTSSSLLPPLSPISSALATSPFLSQTVVPVFSFEVPIHESKVIELLRNVIIPLNDRLTSIVHIDKKGVPRWKKIDFKVEDHVVVVTFPPNLSRQECDLKLRDYVSKVGGEGFPHYETKPLWEIHVVKYSNNNSGHDSLNRGGAVIFKLSHAMGDGYSFLSLVFNGFKRADDPLLPFTVPGGASRINIKEGFGSKCRRTAMKGLNSVPSVGKILMAGSCLGDDKSVVRSGRPRVELEPIDILSINYPLDVIKQVKSKLQTNKAKKKVEWRKERDKGGLAWREGYWFRGTSVNDVITGIIHYAIHLYKSRKAPNSGSDHKRMTTLAMLNMRMILKGHKDINEMLKAGIWGNHSTYLQVPIPNVSPNQNVDPLYFIFAAKKNMKRMKNSFVPQLTFPVINTMKRFKGTKGVADFIYSTLNSTTAMITNVIGPNENMTMAGYPIKDFFCIVAGTPQAQPHLHGGVLVGAVECDDNSREEIHRFPSFQRVHGRILSTHCRSNSPQER
ncbi:hypothetical protein Sjap_017204 [Stephania japonica]|uniref:O-acyltransferase WSD1 C-terminal domain-containing protein n=1 Tax=Stephania japonica TaxID=461633 RepID=A0AAP0I5R3_9MAGN